MRIRTITFDCDDPYPLVAFWTKVTDFREDPENRNEPDDPEGLLVGPDGGLNLLFIKVPEPTAVKNRLRLDLIPTEGSLDEELDRLLEMGATLVADHRQADGEGWVVLADPEGNEFSVERRPADDGTAISEAVFTHKTPPEPPQLATAAPSWLSRLGFRSAGRSHAKDDDESTGPSPLARLARLLSRETGARLGQVIRLVLLVVEALIAVRIILKVAGANEHAGFASFLYKVTSPFVGPFHPVFPDHLVNGHPFEVGSLLAMAVYAALAYLAVRLMRLIASPRR